MDHKAKLKGKFDGNCELKNQLFAEENDEETEGLSVNNAYATKYDEWRSKEELQKLKDRYGDVPEDEDSDSSSSSDSDDEPPTDVFDKEFFKCLSLLRSKDPRIYDKNYQFFANKDLQDVKKKTEKREKPLYLQDYERETLLKYNGELPDEDKDDHEMKLKLESNFSAYDEEQKKLKESFKDALDSENDDDLLTLRAKGEEETKEEEECYQWLKGKNIKLESNSDMKDMQYLRDSWNNPNLDKDEAFLRDYILNKMYIEPKKSKKQIPTYDEIVAEDDDQEEEEGFSDEQEIFEHKFNFRFEEPDPEFIKRYPRTMKDSMRRPDNRRKDKRLEIKERKIQEKQRKREDLKRLKALKRKEIMDKISKIKEITGNTKIGFEDIDLDGDFNAEDHDAKMKAVFDEDYYGEDDVEEDEKPVFDPEEDDDYNDWDEWGEEQEENYHCEDPNFNMDCDYDPNATAQPSSEEAAGSKKKSRKRQSKLWQALKKKKPIFDPSDSTFEEYFDEYYKLDYEDIIDDLPCRFKYRKVISNDFGLSVEEILKADDKELNKWSSLKKTCQIRPEGEEIYEVKAYAKKAKDFEKKRRILKSVYEDENVDLQVVETSKPVETKSPAVETQVSKSRKRKRARANCESGVKEVITVEEIKTLKVADETEPQLSKSQRKRRNKKMRMNNQVTDGNVNVVGEDKKVMVDSEFTKSQQRRMEKKMKWKTQQKVEDESAMDDSRLKAYGINPKRYRNKLKYAPQQM